MDLETWRMGFEGMKTFLKRSAIVCGILAFAALCMGIVYIDTVQNFWYVNGGFVKLIVSNRTSQASISVDTNTLAVGINTNNNSFGVSVLGSVPPTDGTGAFGPSASTSGGIALTGGRGGNSLRGTTATGGQGGDIQITGGQGGETATALTNSTGGTGGQFVLTGGAGGSGQGGIATNATSGGAGGGFQLVGGSGGSPNNASTNTVGGAGGSPSLSGGAGGSPSAGWARKGGNGGSFSIAGGQGGTGARTNGGDGGTISITGGQSGGVSASGGNAGASGIVSITGGAGTAATGGGTNSDGANVFIAGGAPGSGAVPGNVVLARTSAGTSRGAGVQIGPAVGGIVTITNVIGAAASLDFPSTAAGTFSDLPITVTGATSNNVAVCLSVPWMCATNGGAYVAYNSNDTVYVRLINNQLVTAIDPPAGTFTVVGFRIR